MTSAIPLLGFAPDMPAGTPGAMADVRDMVPTAQGFATAREMLALMPALPEACQGAILATDTVGDRRVFAGTQSGLWLKDAGAWASVSRPGGYTGGALGRWQFTQFGNATLCTNDADALQASTMGGAFADVPGAPKSKIIISTADFVMAFNTNDATYGDQGDRWWCSAFRAHSDWAPSVTTQATTGRLIGHGGDITAAARTGSQVVAFKDRSMFLGTYVGPPAVWQWDQVPGDVGCVGPNAVCELGGPLVFVGEDNIWMFDGTRPVALGGGVVRDWFAESASLEHRHKTICAFEPFEGRVWVFFVSAASADHEIDTALVYHLGRQTWGVVSVGAEAVLHYITDGVTMDGLTGSFDGLAVTFDSPAWLAGRRVLSVFDRAHTLGFWGGAGGAGGFLSGHVGDDRAASLVRGVGLRFLQQQPESASVQGFTSAVLGGPSVPAAAGPLDDGAFDCRQSGRWHRFAFELVGGGEVSALSVDAVPAGAR